MGFEREAIRGSRLFWRRWVMPLRILAHVRYFEQLMEPIGNRLDIRRMHDRMVVACDNVRANIVGERRPALSKIALWLRTEPIARLKQRDPQWERRRAVAQEGASIRLVHRCQATNIVEVNIGRHHGVLSCLDKDVFELFMRRKITKLICCYRQLTTIETTKIMRELDHERRIFRASHTRLRDSAVDERKQIDLLPLLKELSRYLECDNTSKRPAAQEIWSLRLNSSDRLKIAPSHRGNVLVGNLTVVEAVRL